MSFNEISSRTQSYYCLSDMLPGTSVLSSNLVPAAFISKQVPKVGRLLVEFPLQQRIRAQLHLHLMQGTLTLTLESVMSRVYSTHTRRLVYIVYGQWLGQLASWLVAGRQSIGDCGLDTTGLNGSRTREYHTSLSRCGQQQTGITRRNYR